MKLPVPEALELARSHFESGRLQDAETVCRAVIDSAPEEHRAYLILAVVCRSLGRIPEAEALCRRALDVSPAAAEVWTDLSAILAIQNRFAEAEAAARRAVELGPSEPIAWYNLGRAFHLPGRLVEAEAAYRRAIELWPEYGKAQYNRAIVLERLGRMDEAEAAYRRLLAADPAFAPAANKLGILLFRKGQAAEAEAAYRQALTISPGHPGARINLGLALSELGRLGEAEQSLLEALGDQSDSLEANTALGEVYLAQGRAAEAETQFARALDARPDSPPVESTRLLCQQYQPGITLDQLARTHRQWDARHAAPLRADWQAHENSSEAERTLRVGFVSADFAEHPVGQLFIGVLESLAGRCETYCYYDRLRRDPMVARHQAAAGVWRDVYAWPDQDLARQIRDDRIDVLVDLAGHSGDHRLLVFARKPAPIQLSWLGYPCTTGMQAIDYILADRYHIPEGEEPYYSEKVLRLPESYVALSPPREAPPVGPLPAISAGRITLGCFANPAKINSQVIALWARALREIAGSRILLKYRGLDDPATARRYLDMFAAENIAADRVELQGRSPRGELLGTYNRVDIALDTFPYSGGLTTFEALWMGAPVVTLPGRTFAGRHALSYLSTAGLAELVAADEADYVRRVVGLAADRNRLATLRRSLRQRLVASPLCDPARLAGHLMDLLRQAWREWCVSGGRTPAAPDGGEAPS